MRKIFILGPQGSGKGTQATLLSEKLSIPHLSMGQLLRDEVASGSELATEISSVTDSGNLVSDELALSVLKKRLEADDTKQGYILDGYPRNEAQYQVYKDYDEPTDVLVLTVPREESLKRMQKRAEVEKRIDDTPEAMRRRLEIYDQDTSPMLDHYRSSGTVREVDGVGTVEEIAVRMAEALGLDN